MQRYDSTDMISVILPVYNGARTFSRAVESVLGQTFRELEILVIDDGSSDGTAELCDRYAEADARVRVFHQENSGVSMARNKGLSAARGTLIAWIDADDYMEPEMLARLYHALRKEEADLAVCGYITEETGGKKSGCGVTDAVMDRSCFCRELILDERIHSYLWDKLFRRELFDGVFFPKDRKYEDQTVLTDIALKIRKAVCISYAGYHYTATPGSTVHTASLKNALDYYLAVKTNRESMERFLPELSECAAMRQLRSIVPLYCCAGYLKNGREDFVRSGVSEEIDTFVRANYSLVRSCSSIGFLGRLILLTIRLSGSGNPCRLLSVLYYRRHDPEL